MPDSVSHQLIYGQNVRGGKSGATRLSLADDAHEDELQFLASLKQGLQDASDLEVLGQQVQRRIDNLESGLTTTPAGSIIATTQYDAAPSPGEAIASGSPSLGTPPSVTNLSKRTRESSSSENAEPTTVRRHEGTLSSQSAATLRCLESLAWGRFTGPCYPHRRCNCMRYRTYAELASVNCDTRDVYLQWSPTNIDPKILLPNNDARRLVKDFHMQHLWWHHNGFHSDTFLEQCEIFWTSGAVVHPLWMALYLAVTCVGRVNPLSGDLSLMLLQTSLWSLANSPRQCRELGLTFDDSLIELQFRKLTEILYEEDFLQNPSMFSVQAITLITRLGHNLGLSQVTGNLLGAAHGIARCLGLHRIQQLPEPTSIQSDPDIAIGQARSDWLEQIEIEVGKRTWWQLVIQDYFSIPFTETYAIHPAQFTTPIPRNCNDADLIEKDNTAMTSSAYTRIIAQQALLMAPALDGLGPLGSRKHSKEIYEHILRCDANMRRNIYSLPTCLLREEHRDSHGPVVSLPWLPTARRTMAISAADKIINIHRPLLFYSFQSSLFPRTRATCTAAAVTILREHERAASEDTVAIWTQTAFCITAVIVLGLELLHQSSHTSETAVEYRQLLSKAGERLRKRACDVLAAKCATLIEVLLSVEEELVIKVMRMRDGTIEEKQREAIDELIASQDILAKFLDLDPVFGMRPMFWESPAASETWDPAVLYDVEQFEDFDVWYNEVFSGVAY
ncbi:uncharacterized protein VDAG_05561 [Verticillium dahliae VdLs.17]|uniref:Transcription factor domain-containing protein n=2 Tax=Verticillium dahliae TaxID=27337 RepID=G2X5Q6_VERDV|nr:uncharacterized protein VDAG_05561 [Verticillium dahliae VdLs.17]EGY14397.1 hypothetical protein VDAG_05561 [Verticillium dahliae VdLs.17]